MTISLQLPKRSTITPQITVFGVGGAGGNAVNNMIVSNLEGVNFVVANTDAQALDDAHTEKRIQLGETITQGLGAGSYPEVGKASAEEAMDQINEQLQGSNMAFVTAGLGGGTGTGASPVIARLAREQGVLTVGVVTKPFHFEGSHRMRVAELGLQELEKYVDTLIVIPNQNLFRIADKNTTFADAFKLADDVLHAGVRGITDLMIMPGLINLDFADVRAVMSEMGKAMMGTGEASGEKRSVEAAEAAISNPLLDNVSMKGARGVLINITGGPDMTLFEVDEAANRVREEVDPDANIIFGSTFSGDLEGVMRVSVVATGIDSGYLQNSEASIGVGLDGNVGTAPGPVFTSGPLFSQPNIDLEDGEGDEVAKNIAEDKTEIASEAEDSPKIGMGYQVNAHLQNKIEEKAESHVDDDANKAFISPEPVEPPSRVRISGGLANNKGLEGNPAEGAVENVPPQQKSRLFGLFGRRQENAPISSNVEENNHSHSSSLQISPAASESSKPSGDVLVDEKPDDKPQDDLDIPAFLRRRST